MNTEDDKKVREPKKVYLGLKKLRHQSGKTPDIHCDNCKCNRYSPCTCKKSKTS